MKERIKRGNITNHCFDFDFLFTEKRRKGVMPNEINSNSTINLFWRLVRLAEGQPERDLKQSSSIILRYNYCKSPGQTGLVRANIKRLNTGKKGRR